MNREQIRDQTESRVSFQILDRQLTRILVLATTRFQIANPIKIQVGIVDRIRYQVQDQTEELT